MDVATTLEFIIESVKKELHDDSDEYVPIDERRIDFWRDVLDDFNNNKPVIPEYSSESTDDIKTISLACSIIRQAHDYGGGVFSKIPNLSKTPLEMLLKSPDCNGARLTRYDKYVLIWTYEGGYSPILLWGAAIPKYK